MRTVVVEPAILVSEWVTVPRPRSSPSTKIFALGALVRMTVVLEQALSSEAAMQRAVSLRRARMGGSPAAGQRGVARPDSPEEGEAPARRTGGTDTSCTPGWEDSAGAGWHSGAAVPGGATSMQSQATL